MAKVLRTETEIVIVCLELSGEEASALLSVLRQVDGGVGGPGGLTDVVETALEKSGITPLGKLTGRVRFLDGENDNES